MVLEGGGTMDCARKSGHGGCWLAEEGVHLAASHRQADESG
jgi:hypothetical protein